jgi:hypothetical protein
MSSAFMPSLEHGGELVAAGRRLQVFDHLEGQPRSSSNWQAERLLEQRAL